MSITAPNGIIGDYIHDGDRLVDPAAQLAGALLEVELEGLNGGPPRFASALPEELAIYLRARGLLDSETAALLTADAATGTLTYEAPKNLAPADFQALGYAITTATGTTHYLFDGTTLGAPAATYDSATGELLVTLPSGTAPADVLSVHLYRPVAGQEQMLAADLFPFGGGGVSLPQIDLLGAPGDPLNLPANLDAIMALAYDANNDADPAATPAWSKPAMSFDGVDTNGDVWHFYVGRKTYAPGVADSGIGPCWKRITKIKP